MPEIWMDVDVALAEVPVNLMPLIDDTDFKTRETAVAFNAAGMDLVWNFVTTAGAFTQTAVTPTSAGDYDWAHQGDAMYSIEIPASAGASINNDTEGFGWFTGVATGVLPWRGPVIGFRAAGLNNLMIDSAHSATRGLAGTALPDAAAEAAGGLYTRGSGTGQIAQDANGRISVNLVAILGTLLTETAGQIAAGFKKLFDVASPVFTLASINQTGDNFARLGAPAGASIAADLVTIAAYIDTEIAAIKAKTDALTFTSAGKVDANMVELNSSAEAALRLMKGALSTGYGTVGNGSSTTSVVASSLAETAADDQFVGRVIVFLSTTSTGALKAQGTTITDYVHATQTFTVVALTTAPQNGDLFIIV